MVVDETTVNEATAVPPKVTLVAPVKLLPVIVTVAPMPAAVGLKELITGAGINVKPNKLAEPPGEITPTEPVEPLPTIAVIVVDETTVNEETAVPPKVTLVAPVKLLPVMVIAVPSPADVGLKELITGAGINVKPDKLAEPPAAVTPTEPVEPLPTIATIEVEETTVNDVTGVPPNVITEVPVKFVPVMLMTAPAAAVTGAKLVIVGAGGKYLYTQTAPTPLLSFTPPTIAVLPSALIETLRPWFPCPTAPEPTNLLPTCVHTPPIRV
jgi:hypothetical protein